MTKVITNDPTSAVQVASACLRHTLGWSIRLVMGLTQQVPETVKDPVRVQIGVYGGSSECLGTLQILGPKKRNRELLDPSSHP